MAPPLHFRADTVLHPFQFKAYKLAAAPQGMHLETSTQENQPPFDGCTWVGYSTSVRLVRDNGISGEPYRVRGPVDVYNAFRSLAEIDRERFYGVHLDTRHQVCGVELVSQGILDASLVTPREVFKSAILANASGLILVHNHPSGCPRPSPEDESLTNTLRDGGRLLGIPVLDHVIIGDQTYFSFADSGLL